MKKHFAALGLACVLLTALVVRAADIKQDLSKPIPGAARELVKRAMPLAERDHLPESIAVLKKAMALAPNYVNAHAEYIYIKGYFANSFDEVRAEYENLKRREPDNPVYSMALALGSYHVSSAAKTSWYQQAVKLAPDDWAWRHYAKAMLVFEKEPETAAAEFLKYVETDGTWSSAYSFLSYLQEKPLKRIDDAIRTAQRMAANPEFRAEGLSLLWRLQLRKFNSSEVGKSNLRKELSRFVAESNDIKILNTVRLVYKDLLEEEENALAVKNKIIRLDSSWYPERGKLLFAWAVNASRISRIVIVVNRQYSIYNELSEIRNEPEPPKQIKRLEKLLLLQRPNAGMKRYIYEQIFDTAEKSEDANSMIKYGAALYAIERSDTVILSKIALALAKQKKNLQTALRYARLAEKATLEYQPVKRPANDGLTEAEWHKERFTENQQQQHYKKIRATALDALGYALCQTGNCDEAETKLRESVALNRSEQNLTHLSFVLEKLGKREEAEKYAAEAKAEYTRKLKESIINEPAQDFELIATDGRRVKLSDLQGKVVMMDFWTTWCAPCIESVPVLNELYEKYKARGLEILYVSADDEADMPKIIPFAQKHKINFPVLFDNGGVKASYKITGFPTVVFIDKNGKLRFRETGFGKTESPRKYQTIINELLEK